MTSTDPTPDHQDKIAQLAGSMTEMHLDALRGLEQFGLSWQDLVFAAVLSLRSVALLAQPDEEKAASELRAVLERALRQTVLAKRFSDKEAMQAWMAEQGLEVEVEDADDGQVRH